MATEARLRVLVADDHETTREGLRAVLDRQPDMSVVATAADGLEAISRTTELLPDIVLMDISMPNLNGLQATEAIRRFCPNVRVIAFTRHSDDEYLQLLLHAGAAGYVLKQSPTSGLLNAIRAVAAGGKYLDPAVVDRVVRPIGSSSPGTPPRPDVRALSPREEQVLRLVAAGYANKEIGNRLGVSVKTVETHKANAMQKLSLHNRVDVMRFAVAQGWLEQR